MVVCPFFDQEKGGCRDRLLMPMSRSCREIDDVASPISNQRAIDIHDQLTRYHVAGVALKTPIRFLEEI